MIAGDAVNCNNEYDEAGLNMNMSRTKFMYKDPVDNQQSTTNNNEIHYTSSMDNIQKKISKVSLYLVKIY